MKATADNTASHAGLPRSMVWHCQACGGYHLHDMFVTQPIVCPLCGAKGLVAAAPVDIPLPLFLPGLCGTG